MADTDGWRSKTNAFIHVEGSMEIFWDHSSLKTESNDGGPSIRPSVRQFVRPSIRPSVTVALAFGCRWKLWSPTRMERVLMLLLLLLLQLDISAPFLHLLSPTPLLVAARASVIGRALWLPIVCPSCIGRSTITAVLSWLHNVGRFLSSAFRPPSTTTIHPLGFLVSCWFYFPIAHVVWLPNCLFPSSPGLAVLPLCHFPVMCA